MKVVISKSFSTRTDRSDRVINVAEAFGLGLEDREFTVFDNLELDIEPGDVIYILGQSGSGKSTLLRELTKKLGESLKVADLETAELKDVPVIDQVCADGDNNSLAEAIRLLSIVGLSDAYLYIRKPGELSDGQRYRLRLAKLIEQKADVWVADEFGAVLDRVTAKVISYNISKLARQMNKILIVATTHRDLEEELAPSLKIVKNFHDRVTVDGKRINVDSGEG